MPPPLVGEALADRRVFERERFATFSPAAATFFLAAAVGFGAAGENMKKQIFCQGLPY